MWENEGLFSVIEDNAFVRNVHFRIQQHVVLYAVLDIMVLTTSDLLPSHRRLLSAMGENIKMARLLGRLSAAQVGERANITRATLYNIEKGLDTVSMGAYFFVLVALRLENDILLLAKDDCWDVNYKI